MPRDLQRGGPLILLLKHGIYGMDIWNRRRNMYLHISTVSLASLSLKKQPPKKTQQLFLLNTKGLLMIFWVKEQRPTLSPIIMEAISLASKVAIFHSHWPIVGKK